ncbi:MAG: nuclease-related domain-containing protein [Lachnospiraceae bacterium]|nr:nuclease-related domain-containing protein [Lachnospiraceae bacterium]
MIELVFAAPIALAVILTPKKTCKIISYMLAHDILRLALFVAVCVLYWFFALNIYFIADEYLSSTEIVLEINKRLPFAYPDILALGFSFIIFIRYLSFISIVYADCEEAIAKLTNEKMLLREKKRFKTVCENAKEEIDNFLTHTSFKEALKTSKNPILPGEKKIKSDGLFGRESFYKEQKEMFEKIMPFPVFIPDYSEIEFKDSRELTKYERLLQFDLDEREIALYPAILKKETENDIYEYNSNLQMIKKELMEEYLSVNNECEGKRRVKNNLLVFGDEFGTIYDFITKIYDPIKNTESSLKTDVIIVSKGGIFCVGIKNIPGNIIVSKDGKWQRYVSGEAVLEKNPILESNFILGALHGIINQAIRQRFGWDMDIKIPLYSLLVITNDDAKITNESDFAIVRPELIREKLRTMPRADVIKDSQIDDITELIRELGTEEIKKDMFDYTDIYSTYFINMNQKISKAMEVLKASEKYKEILYNSSLKRKK